MNLDRVILTAGLLFTTICKLLIFAIIHENKNESKEKKKIRLHSGQELQVDTPHILGSIIFDYTSQWRENFSKWFPLWLLVFHNYFLSFGSNVSNIWFHSSMTHIFKVMSIFGEVCRSLNFSQLSIESPAKFLKKKL